RLQVEVADGVEQPQHAERRHVGRVLRHLERDLDVALGREVVDLVRLQGIERARQAVLVDQIAVVQHQALADVVDAPGVERAAAAHQPVHLVALVEQQLGQVAAVLAGDPGDERLLRQSALRKAESRRRGEASTLPRLTKLAQRALLTKRATRGARGGGAPSSQERRQPAGRFVWGVWRNTPQNKKEEGSHSLAGASFV